MRRWIAALSFLCLMFVASCGDDQRQVTDQSVATATPAAAVASPTRLPPPPPPPELTFSAFWFADAQTGWVGGTRCHYGASPTRDAFGSAPPPEPEDCEGRIYRTDDGGQSWRLEHRGSVGQFVFADTRIGLGVNSNSYCPHSPCPSEVLRTTDGGRTWTQTYNSSERLSSLSIIGNEAWLLANSCGYDDRGPCTWHLLKSTDLGQTWNQLPLPLKALGLSISRPTAMDGWIATMSGGGPAEGELWVTHDGGETWRSLPHPMDRGLYGQAIFFRTPEEGWLLTGGLPGAGNQLKSLYRTNDGGTTWTMVAKSQLGTRQAGIGDLETAGYVGPVLFTSAQEGWILLSRRGLAHSSDGGKTWSMSMAGETFAAFHFLDAQHGWLAIQGSLSQPGLLWTTKDGGATWQQVPLPTPDA